MGKLRRYTVNRQTRPTTTRQQQGPAAPSGRKRTLGLALVAVVGVMAGGGLAAAVYHVDNNPQQSALNGKSSVPPAFAAAVEAVFDTSRNKEADQELQLQTASIPSTEESASEAGEGLSWTPDDEAETKLPNVVVVSSTKPAKPVASDETQVASLATTSTFNRPTFETPQRFDSAATENVAEAGSPHAFAKEPISARALKERIEAQLASPAAAAISSAMVDAEERAPAVAGAGDDLAPLGSLHFLVLPETVSSVAEAVALQNGWKTTAKRDVNLRTRPSNKGEVITVIPAKSELLIERDCTRWCAVIHDGRKGYVHRTFVSQSKRPEDQAAPQPVTTESTAPSLQQRMGATQANQNFVAAQSNATYATEGVSDAGSDGYRKGYATKYVNMRAAPEKDAQVLTVVPAEQEIMVEPNCRHWCSAVYKDQRGYIYRTFFQYSGTRAEAG
ncbi:MAG: SH3 domain-containing protein [Pseudomonadota bacterium]